MKTKIIEACQTHGAKAVYDAAFAHMSGNKSALAKVGLAAANLGQANEIGSVAFGLLSPVDQAGDLADAAIKLAKLP